MAYTDLDSLHTPTAGNRPPASWGAAVNANFDHYNDYYGSMVGAWTTFTPTLTQSNTPTKTVTYASYLKLGRMVTGHVVMTVTSAGTAANPIIVGLPVAMAGTGNLVIGSGWVYDASGVIGYSGALIRVTSTTAIIWAHGETNNVGADPNFALANTDQISYQFTYESAS